MMSGDWARRMWVFGSSGSRGGSGNIVAAARRAGGSAGDANVR